MLPFTREQFFAVFAAYNEAVWPVQYLAYLLALAMLVALVRGWPGRDRLVSGGLAAMWVWTGVAYHGLYFAPINPAALGFAALFVVQGVLMAHAGLMQGRLRFEVRPGWRGLVGWCLVAYAAIVYPLLGWAAGHRYPEMPSFGITPCPVTLFTFGMLLLAAPVIPRRLLVIPLLWSLVGGSAAVLLGVPQDWPLLISGLCLAPLLWPGKVQPGNSSPPQGAA
ncbi:MAG: DUF6064 family protein [Rhizobacter sp.]